MRTRLRLRPPGAADLRAGLTHGLVSVPDGLASGLLAGLNPVAGLYGYLFGTLTGALATSSALMSVQGTGAMAVIIADTPGLDDARSLASLGVATGLIMLAAGLAGLGAAVRYVPHAVLVGFINAVAINIVLGQLSGFTGFTGRGSNRVSRALDTVLHVGRFDWPTVAVAVGTVGLIIALERTPLRSLGLVVAVIVSSASVAVLPILDVPLLRDLSAVPRGLPTPALPAVGAMASLLVPAAALAFVGLVQGTAISQSVPNPDGRYPDVSGDFRGQGLANIASGLFRGVPVGGSMSGTAVLVAAGAKSRWGNLVAALTMVLAILLLAPVIGQVAMPALAGLLVLVGIRTLKVDQVLMVWRTGATQAAVMSTTFLLTLLIPMQYAVLSGVGIAVILFVARQSNRVSVRRWTFREGSPLPTEVDPPAVLDPGEIVVLTPYGSLFFASANTFERQLPVPGADAAGAVVVLRLRGKEELGSTFIKTITRYHASLVDARAHLVLTGVGERVLAQLTSTGAIKTLGSENVFAATHNVGESLQAGMARARQLRGGTEPSPRE